MKKTKVVFIILLTLLINHSTMRVRVFN